MFRLITFHLQLQSVSYSFEYPIYICEVTTLGITMTTKVEMKKGKKPRGKTTNVLKLKS